MGEATVSSLHFNQTPTIAVCSNRGSAVREISYHRHPLTPELLSARVTQHTFDALGNPYQSADPRLRQERLANIIHVHDLVARNLRTQSVDAGIHIVLHDSADRPLISITNISPLEQRGDDLSQAVTHTTHYECPVQSGRPLDITEGFAGEPAQVTERFLYSSNSQHEKALNLAGRRSLHYDPAGKLQTISISLTVDIRCEQRRLLAKAEDETVRVDWYGNNSAEWDRLLGGETYITRNLTDSTGNLLAILDCAGNTQFMEYDTTGSLSAHWLKIAGKERQTITESLQYSANGKVTRAQHGNRTQSIFSYQPRTLRLAATRIARDGDNPQNLRDLRNNYDPTGNLVRVSDIAQQRNFWRNQQAEPCHEYIYDSLYQLVICRGRETAGHIEQAACPPPITTIQSGNATVYTRYSRNYVYDDAGNLTQIRHSAPTINRSFTRDVIISRRSNRGVLATQTKRIADVDALFTPDGHQRFLLPGQPMNWTLRGELRQVTLGDEHLSEHYRYDGNQRRIQKTQRQKQSTLYLRGIELRTAYDQAGNEELLYVLTPASVGHTQVRILHWQSGKPDGIPDDQMRWSYGTFNDSCELELDSEGNLISQEEYYPYGGTAILTARSQREVSYRVVRYSGKERDATGLYYYGLRHYQTWTGRWVSADPAMTADGLNLFCMVRNNPTTFMDDQGLQTLDQLFEPMNGDLIYGLATERSKYIESNVILLNYQRSRNALLIDDYNLVVGTSIHMLTGLKSSNIRNQSILASKPATTINEFVQKIATKTAVAYPLWESYFSTGKERAKLNIANIYQEVYSRWKVTRFHTWRDDNFAPDLFLKRASKLGVEMAARGETNKIHFILDSLDLSSVISKKDSAGLFGIGRQYKGTSITASELRYAYRNRERLKGKILFYNRGQHVEAPWVTDAAAWQKYKPKSLSAKRTVATSFKH